MEVLFFLIPIACFVFFILLMAVAGSVGFLKVYKQSRGMPSWPTTQGRIMESMVNDYIDTSDGGRERMYIAKITYEYKIESKSFTGTNISPAGQPSYNIKRFVSNIVNKYPEGTIVEVMYNPNNPAEAYLERNGNWVWLLVTGFMAVVSLGLIGFCVFNIVLTLIEGYTPDAP